MNKTYDVKKIKCSKCNRVIYKTNINFKNGHIYSLCECGESIHEDKTCFKTERFISLNEYRLKKIKRLITND